MRKPRTIVLFYLIVTIMLMVSILFYHNSVRLERGVYMSQAGAIPHFELMDNENHLFTENKLHGHWSLLFFGFSSCQMICPLTLQILNQTYEHLDKTIRPQIIFISVDPEQDTVQKLNHFVHQFNEQFIALRGPMAAVNSLQKQLHVTVSSAPMNHGTEIVLINPQGKVQAYFYHPISTKELVTDLNQLIK